jgi:hypothetical protein
MASEGLFHMKKCLGLLLCSLFALPCAAQNIASRIQTMKVSYASSGNIVILDDRTIVIEPKMPSPLLALPSNKDGRTTWSYYAFPLASIVVPLAAVDETLISEDSVFTNPDAAKGYKPGDEGDATMVVVAGVPGKQFHTQIYDRDKLESLGPGPHSGSEYGQSPDDTVAFGLTFSDRAQARAFEMALKDAVILAKAQAGQTARQ